MDPRPRHSEHDLVREVATKGARKRRARRRNDRGLWYGLGMFGLVGWSVALPTLACLALGLWIDTRYPGPLSWTLMLLAAGIALGCLNAWYWVKKESAHEDERGGDEWPRP